MKNIIQTIASKYGIGMSKSELINKIYFELKALVEFKGFEREYEIHTINELYLGVNEEKFQFIKSKKTQSWIVKEF